MAKTQRQPPAVDTANQENGSTPVLLKRASVSYVEESVEKLGKKPKVDELDNSITPHVVENRFYKHVDSSKEPYSPFLQEDVHRTHTLCVDSRRMEGSEGQQDERSTETLELCAEQSQKKVIASRREADRARKECRAKTVKLILTTHLKTVEEKNITHAVRDLVFPIHKFVTRDEDLRFDYEDPTTISYMVLGAMGCIDNETGRLQYSTDQLIVIWNKYKNLVRKKINQRRGSVCNEIKKEFIRTCHLVASCNAV